MRQKLKEKLLVINSSKKERDEAIIFMKQEKQ